MTSLSEANKKLLAGQELTNVDLSDLSACYAAMASILEQLNDVHFYLFRREVNRRLEILEGFKRERKSE